MILSVISKKLRQFPVLVVSVILIVLSTVLFIMRGPKLQDYETRLTDLEREWANIQKNVERSSGLESDITNLEEGLASIRSRLLNVDEVASNYEFFYDLERRTGVNVRQFSQGIANDGSMLPIGREGLRHFTVVPYDISMSGSLQSILNVLDLLERQKFIVRMDLFSVSLPAETPGQSNQLNAKLRCNVLASKND